MLTAVRAAAGQGADRTIDALAQVRIPVRAGIDPIRRDVDASLFGVLATVPVADSAVVQSTGSGRSKLIAGVASGFLPGLGSFYAGHVRHGVVHLVIHTVTGTLALAGTISCVTAWGGETDCPSAGVMQLVAGTWIVNWAWSIVSAVNDAGAHNARRGS